ncbi:MAG: 2-dehydropantoate 2-reductase [Acidobacteria bacterium]|nr:2-dehydropantoate 2-reductase [Acidobacteriota bacterium]
MRVAIVGPGAIGCTIGAYLVLADNQVTFLARDEARAHRLRRSGIRVEGVRGSFRVPVAATADAGRAGSFQLVLVCVKAYDTAAAMAQHAAAVGPTTIVATFQNGLGNVEALAGVVGEGRVLGGTTAMGANVVGPGRVHHAGAGETFVGEPSGELSGRAEHIARQLTAAGVETRAVRDIRARLWSKVAVNCGINALTAILRVRNGVLPRHAETLAVMDSAVREAVAVARARGLPLEAETMVERTREVARRTADNVSSMLADVRARRRSEIAEINGAVAAAAREAGLSAPVNETLAFLVCAVEATASERV